MPEPRDPTIDAAFDQLRSDVEHTVDVEASLAALHRDRVPGRRDRRWVRALAAAAVLALIAGGAAVWRSASSNDRIETTSDPADSRSPDGEVCRSQSVLVLFEPTTDPADLLAGSRQLGRFGDGSYMLVNALDPDEQVLEALRDDPDGRAAESVRASAAYRILVAGRWPTEDTAALERVPGVMRVVVLPCRGPVPPITAAAPGD